MSTPVPALSEDGWVTAPQQMGDYMFSHFYLAEKSQSYSYAGNVASLPYLIQAYQDDVNGLQIETQKVLTAYFSRYFSSVTIETSVTPEAAGSSRYTLSIYVSYTAADGKLYNLAKLIDVLDTKIAKVIDANNNGAAHA